MTNRARAKKLFGPILERNSDLVLDDRYILLKPIRHFFLGVYICAARELIRFLPERVEIALLGGHGTYKFGASARIETATRGHFYWNDPARLDEVRETIDTVVLPELRAVKTFENYIGYKQIKFIEKSVVTVHEYQTLSLLIANGDLDRARSFVQGHIENKVAQGRDGKRPEDVYVLDWIDEMRGLLPMLADNDIVGMAAFLRGLEERSVRKVGLEQYWEPTPFPLEEKWLARGAVAPKAG